MTGYCSRVLSRIGDSDGSALGQLSGQVYLHHPCRADARQRSERLIFFRLDYGHASQLERFPDPAPQGHTRHRTARAPVHAVPAPRARTGPQRRRDSSYRIVCTRNMTYLTTHVRCHEHDARFGDDHATSTAGSHDLSSNMSCASCPSYIARKKWHRHGFKTELHDIDRPITPESCIDLSAPPLHS